MAPDLQSVFVNRGSETTSVNSHSKDHRKLYVLGERKISCFLADHGDQLYFHLANDVVSQYSSSNSLDDFGKESHVSLRITDLFADFDKQYSSGDAIIKSPYGVDGADYYLDKSYECTDRTLGFLSLNSDNSPISTTLTSAPRKITVDVGRNQPYHAKSNSRTAIPFLPRISKSEGPCVTTAELESTAFAKSHIESYKTFQILDSAVLDILALDIRLAGNVITHLYKLPADLRALVYGFIAHGNQGGGSSNFALPQTESSSTYSAISQNQKGISATPPLQKRERKEDSDSDSESQRPENKRCRSRVYSKAIVSRLKYACPFNIKDPTKYRVMNELGSTGDLYTSCMGMGWANLHGLLGTILSSLKVLNQTVIVNPSLQSITFLYSDSALSEVAIDETSELKLNPVSEHLRDHHRRAQCIRCWQIFDDQVALDSHTYFLEPRCPDMSSDYKRREGIDSSAWKLVEKALRTPKPGKSRDVVKKSDYTKWMEVWDTLFPTEFYPDLPRPKHPYYVDPETVVNPFTSSDETEKKVMIAEAIWEEKAKMANPNKPFEGYRAGWHEIEQIIRKADAIIAKSYVRTPLSSVSQEKKTVDVEDIDCQFYTDEEFRNLFSE